MWVLCQWTSEEHWLEAPEAAKKRQSLPSHMHLRVHPSTGTAVHNMHSDRMITHDQVCSRFWYRQSEKEEFTVVGWVLVPASCLCKSGGSC